MACALTFGALPFDFADWGDRGMLGVGVVSGWETMLIFLMFLFTAGGPFTFGGCLLVVAHVLIIGTWMEVMGKHARKTSTKGYCLIQGIVALTSIIFFEMTFLKVNGFPAARAWQVGQVCSVAAVTVYAFSITRQLRIGSI